MKYKSFFEQFKEEIEEEHSTFKTHAEKKELIKPKCTHFGKVKSVKGELRCQCGASWSGYQLNILADHFNKT